jgi:Tol biopolymer transport system component
VIPIVTDLVGLQAGYASWSTGHSALAYGDAGIRILDPSKLTSTSAIDGSTISMPSFSPRGTSIVFGDGVHMGVIPLQSSQPLPGPSPTPGFAELPLPDTIAPYAFDWAGSKQIVFQGVALDCSDPERCLATPASDIWTIHPDGTNLLQVTTTGDAGSPKWAPGGHRFLYVRTSLRKGFGSQLWTAKANGTAPHALIAARNVVAADWSQDGKRLVVIRLDPATSSLQIWVGNEDGSNLQQLGDALPGTSATVDW